MANIFLVSFLIIETFIAYIFSNMFNLVIFYCIYLKSRAGLMICCYLLHISHFLESKDALKYFDEARIKDDQGFILPSQQRYVHYYSYLLRNGLAYEPTFILLKGFEMSPVPTFLSSTCSKWLTLF